MATISAKAMVLCAGLGTRLGDLTREIPKPMLPLHGQPLLAYLLSNLRSQGFNDVAVNLHFRPEVISDWFGDGSSWQMRLTYSHEARPLGTAGGVKNVEPYFHSEEYFLVHYGDILTDQNFGAMVRFHRERKALATLLVHRRAKSNSAITLEANHRISGFLERPTEDLVTDMPTPWVNSGVAICSPEILDHIPSGQFVDFPRDVFSKLVDTGRLYGFPISGYRCAIDSAARLDEARNAIEEGRCNIHPLIQGS